MGPTITLFEDTLRERAERDSNARVLASQWDFDRRLLESALAAIGIYFPHYSRHDASHAGTILVQLARILGAHRISCLASTDLWLILEAAYHHDVGMVIADVEVQKFWKSVDFQTFRDDLRISGGELAEVSARLGDPTHYVGSSTWPLQVRRDLTLLIAEFVRSRHPQRAAEIIHNPLTIGLESPRHTLIPARLWRHLGSICEGHGKFFGDVMKLPQRENGLGCDNAHPRFVACLLRLGDLLDLDNNRFCPVMLASFGPLPASSEAHRGKHASIVSFRSDEEEVSVVAECKDLNVYVATEGWLAYLRDELRDQAARWGEIAPHPSLGLLPRAGTIEARLMDGTLVFAPGCRPHFEVSRGAFLSLAKGSNLYAESGVWMRELLQNAIDATLLRIYAECEASGSDWRREAQKDPLTWLRRAQRGYSITVSLSRVSGPPNVGQDKVRWRIEVRDRGIGIGEQDIKALQHVGSSERNRDRHRQISGMPEWMRPSGAFGVGIQSVFGVATEVRIRTHHALTHECFEITLMAGQDGLGENIVARRLLCNEVPDVGTTVVFDALFDRVPRVVPPDIVDLLGGDFDPCAGGDLPVEIFAAVRVAESLRRAHPAIVVSSQVAGELSPGEPDQQGMEYLCRLESSAGLKYVQVSQFRLNKDDRSDGRARLFYRGIPVGGAPEPSRYRMGWYNQIIAEFDLHFGRSQDILNMSRDRVRRESKALIDDVCAEAALECLIRAKCGIGTGMVQSNDVLPRIGLYLLWARSVDKEGSWRRCCERVGVHDDVVGEEYWDLPVTKGKRLADFRESGASLRADRFGFGRQVRVTSGRKRSWEQLNPVGDVAFSLAFGSYCFRGSAEGFFEHEFSPTSSLIGPFSDRGLETFLKHYLLEPMMSGVSGRIVMPVPPGAAGLAVRGNTVPLHAKIAMPPGLRVLNGYQSMMCPFQRIYNPGPGQNSLRNLLEYLCWVYEHRMRSATSRQEIAVAALKFIEKVDSLMEKSRAAWQRQVPYSMDDARKICDTFVHAGSNE